MSDLREESSLLDHVEVLFRSLIDAEISEAIEPVEDLQSEALRSVFQDQDLSVRGEISTERGKVSVSLVTAQKESDGSIITEGGSNDTFGGSVTTVESMLNRILVVMRRGLRPLFVMDEAFPAFDPDYAANWGEFLKAVCDKMGVDILMVTHNHDIFESAHKGYRIRRHPGGAKFDPVHG
jgi:hypothetical protein